MFKFPSPVFNSDGGSGGGDPPPAPPPPAPPAPPPAVNKPVGYSAEFVHDLREENKGWRLKATEQEKLRKDAEAAADAAKQAADAAKAEADARIEAARQEAKAAADQRVILAELKALAIKAGMIDLDGLKLADVSGVKLSDAGEVEGGAELIDKLKEAKPYLFAAKPGGTSNPTPPPKPGETKPKTAREMTKEEYAAYKAQILKGA